MPMEAQTRLLRVLQESEYTTVGGRKLIRADVRIVAATNQNLATLIDAGMFREDLYYRLNVVPLRLPSLRERRQDVPELVEHFLARGATMGLPQRRFSPAALARLERHDWPGNVRELENMVRRLVVMSIDDMIGEELVERELLPTAPRKVEAARNSGLEEGVREFVSRAFAEHGPKTTNLHARVLAEVEKPLIAAVLSEVRGNQLRAAALLGLNRNTLRKRIRELEINLPSQRKPLK